MIDILEKRIFSSQNKTKHKRINPILNSLKYVQRKREKGRTYFNESRLFAIGRKKITVGTRTGRELCEEISFTTLH